MVFTRVLISVGIVAAAAFPCTDAFTAPRRHVIGARRGTSSSLHVVKPKGCAAKPFEKKKVVVFGAGGYLGGIIFGFLQRASNLYGTGISAGSSPRAICATNGGAEGLNKVLTPGFKLAYAGEDLIRLVDTSDVDYMKERLKNFDAAILGTTYQLERRPVTGNTYEKNVNSKAFEIYLDERYGAWQVEVPSDDSDIHTSIFRNSVQACKESGFSHLVVVETPRTVNPVDFINILEEEGVAYTYIRTASALVKDMTYTFEKGITNKLEVARLSTGSSLARGEPLSLAPFDENKQPVTREDFAALVVQSLMTLDWGESRILEVSSSPGSSISTEYGAKKSKLIFDKEWCPNSELLAEVLSAL
ncbi:hypothetical protein ACHAXR_006306 [Thalassiosira sp. AJA248-18]